MKVTKPGLVHEYANCDETVHLYACIACLERLSPIDGASILARANEYRREFRGIQANAQELHRAISEAMEKVIPEGLYYGRPSVHSNMLGFWPAEWLDGATPRNPKGVPDSVARTYGMASFSGMDESDAAQHTIAEIEEKLIQLGISFCCDIADEIDSHWYHHVCESGMPNDEFFHQLAEKLGISMYDFLAEKIAPSEEKERG